jgi:dihydroorotase
VGSEADLCVFDPALEWVIKPDDLRSQGKHTPFGGYSVPGKVHCTLVGGQLAFLG